MSPETMYVMQASFTAGEVSPEVANRTDIDKYGSALINAENCYIRPYGSVIRRGGSLYCGEAKYPDKRCILRPFGTGYLLEFGEKYVRMWKDGAYLGQECVTPYTEDDLDRLRFAQSADVLFIASGTHPVMTLSRYADEDWRFGEFEITDMYYDALLGGELEKGVDEYYGTPGTFTYIAPADGTYAIEIAGGGGGGALKAKTGTYGGSGEKKSFSKDLVKDETYTITVGAGGAAGELQYNEDDEYVGTTAGNGGDTEAFGETARGGGAAGQGNGASYGNGGAGGSAGSIDAKATGGKPGWVSIKMDSPLEIIPSGTKKEITLTASKDFFQPAMTGSYMKIQHDMPSQTVTKNGGGTSTDVLCGDQWKIITHGTWSGSVKIQKSVDGEEWEDYREYKSNNDFNASESGTVDEYTRLRIVSTAGNSDLTILPYTHEGVVKITEVVSGTEAKADVIEPLGSTKAISGYMWGAWSDCYGWPSAIGFFQDRLCLAATKQQPYYLWMSRTGDYGNFSVEKASGTVTDDSAVALSFISRKQNTIRHIVPASDLIIMTDGDEWTVSGASTVTPTEAVPKLQTSRGCTDAIPTVVGGRIVYVQRRGKTVRDMGYSFETDNYDGMDLTLLAKHLTKDTEIIDQTYMQDPDSVLFFALKNGHIACLSYVKDQKVYAWSHLVTAGNFESVCDVEEEEEDSVYAVVKRDIRGQEVRTIERLTMTGESDDPMDSVMMDCAVQIEGKTEAAAPHLAGEKAGVLADGRYFKDIEIDEDGHFQIPAEAKRMIVGLPYTTKIELPNIEISTQQGTVQGRNKNVRGVSLRLLHSLGGKVGNGKGPMDEIKYDELQGQEVTLYTDDKEVTIPNPGVEKHGRVLIETSEPYPFNLAAIVREVVINA